MRGTLLFALVSAVAAGAETINFDSVKPGDVPTGMSVAMTHQGGAPKWEVLADSSAPSKPNAVAQTSTDKSEDRFPLLVYEKASLKDGELRVSFKPVSGTVNQGGGLIWRYKDQNNYYLVRADARENNVILWKVKDGTRTPIRPKGSPQQRGASVKVPLGTWSTLGVTFKGNLFAVSFNGQKLLEVEDDTFVDAGRVGLWTKADSVTYFDDFVVEP